MEPKKNPKYDVHNKRSVIFNFSLVLSLVVVIMAFRWSVPVTPEPVPPEEPTEVYSDYNDVAVTDHNISREAPKPVQVEIKKPILPVFTEVDNLTKGTADTPPVEQTVGRLGPISIHIEPEEDTTIYDYFPLEDAPQPVGGYETFYKTLNSNIKYPRRAIQTRTEGRVFVQFTIDKSGELTDLKVVRGISKELDAESLRVIALTKWKAGKQRGKPVRARMVLPVNFVLN